MADNLIGDNSGNVLVEFDYDNIIVVDPNKTYDPTTGRIAQRLVDHENLVMYANLEADVLPRTKLLVGVNPEDRVQQTISIAKINFLKPTKNDYLGTGYYDELTGKNSLFSQQGSQTLPKTNNISNGSTAYKNNSTVDDQNVLDNGLLGITSIDVKISSSFIPSVSMKLEDVQGKALFQLGDQSPYSAFFNLPYPQFYLTLKGYYGQAIRYQLNLEKFNARFNGSSGNYEIDLDFRGYKFNILNEITIQHLLATPHMYSKRFNVNVSQSEVQKQNSIQQGSGNPANQNLSASNPNQAVTTLVSEKGYQKITEVYSDYKSKGLIPPDFPELTLMQLMNKFETFQQNIVNSYPPANVEPLTNIRNYKKTLKSYYESIRGAQGSWFTKYLDPRPIILKNGGQKVYYFKEDVRRTAQTKSNANTELIAIFQKNNLILKENPTLGEGKPNEIKLNNLSPEMVKYNFNLNDVDLEKTATSFYNVIAPSVDNVTKAKQEIESIVISSITLQTSLTPKEKSSYENFLNIFFTFDGSKGFDQTINLIDTEATKKLSAAEEAITEDLKNKIQDSAFGIGFNPTARNIVAVIMANTEGFIRLLDDVHTNAWNEKYNPVRVGAIQNNPSAAQNTEVVQPVPITQQAASQNTGLSTAQTPVYPWPQFFVETPDDKKGRYQLKYLGDPSVVDLTQAYNFQSWPEVEFVEEYIKGINQKFNSPISQPPIDQQGTTFLINYNAIEYPQNGLSYFNKQEIKFLYEIWERQFLTSHYSNFSRIEATQFNELLEFNNVVESDNIVKSLGLSNPYLTNILKTTPFSSTNYSEYLKKFSNDGTGIFYQDFIKDFFVTPYIKVITENPFSVLTTQQLGLEPQSNVAPTALLNIVKQASNTPKIIDTYPFTDSTWVENNMELSINNQKELVYNTNKSLKVFTNRNVISNFENIFDHITNQPVTNFSFTRYERPNFSVLNNQEAVKNNLKLFYEGRTPLDFLSTEGYMNSITPTNSLPNEKSTSILNTPFFINAIQEGVAKQQNNEKYPYISAAYLFINSLPLASLRERYKTKGTTTELDYIASCFNKFGAVHKMPYAWVLKLGSIWYRYKKFVNDQVDILDAVWRDFDYNENYDPITNSIEKSYTIKILEKTYNIVLQTTSNTQNNMQVGFYPKLINDFNYFYNGENLYKNYTNEEIQDSVSKGMKIYQFPYSNFAASQKGVSTNLFTWSVLLPKSIKSSANVQLDCVADGAVNVNVDYFVIPSFGCNLNQAGIECVNNGETVTDLTSNSSVFNGSVRLFWGAPNYGYFDKNYATKPDTKSYMNFIDPLVKNLPPFRLMTSAEYSKIEEIFSVFDLKSLNIIEQEFLNFCKPSTNISYEPNQSEIDKTLIQLNSNFRNFQSFMKSGMNIVPNGTDNTNELLFDNAITKQINTFGQQVKSFMEYDVIIRNGNPSKYSRRIWDSYLSIGNTNNFVDRPITFATYVSGSLPTNGGTTTLQQSKSGYPIEWRTLETEVGFSTIPELVYKDSGSYITDFFVDNNLAFNVENIVLMSQLVKMYATQKLKNSSTNQSSFQNELSSYLNTINSAQNQLLGGVLQNTEKKLPNQSQVPEKTINSQLSGVQGKSELYDVFKSLNDKWISGGDYKNKTLFEDILFLDRASRNIGDTIILDIFDIKSMLNTNHLNEGMTVFTLISGMLIKNNFNVMPLPAYVNFYNVQNVDGLVVPNPEGNLVFADNLWGTFKNVDYRKSGPKMICFFVGKPSSALPLPPQVSGYGNDSFELRRGSGNPLVENLQGKNDWDKSNRCVGFNVDIGIRNQNIFTSFNVSQANGKATSESIQAIVDIVNQSSGRSVGNQNFSLYEFYKRRSYECDVTCLGNALIQPTMYFNLRHVPMFYGPYYITEVSHSISPGNFTTSFRGVRQGIYDLPAIDNFLQSINQNLLSQIEELIVNKKDDNTTAVTTEQGKANNVINNANSNSLAADNSCGSNLLATVYPWTFTEPTLTELTASQLRDELNNKFLNANDNNLKIVIYYISYIRTFAKSGDGNGKFTSYNNNFGLISLNYDNGAKNQYFTNNEYYCFNSGTKSGTKSLPMAKFPTVRSYLDYMETTIRPNMPRIFDNLYGLQRYYVCDFPVSQVSESYYNQNIDQFTEEFEPILDFAAASAKNVGLEIQEGQVKPSPTPTCPDVTITSLIPTSGKTGTIVTMKGTGFNFVTNVFVGDTSVDIRSIQIIDATTLKFSIPLLPVITSQQVSVEIKSVLSSNNVVSPIDFGYEV